MTAHVAFLGTGIMGTPMCAHLLAAGFPTRVWNRTSEKAAGLVHQGAELCASPSEAVIGAEFVVVMLSTGPIVTQVLFQPDSTGRSVAQALGEGSTVVVMSSIPVDTSREHATRLEAVGVRYIDAPVSGGERGARDASLAIMAGGDETVITGARPLLETMGRVTRVGPVGSGQLAKLANQIIVGITIGAVAEALVLARAGGAEPTAVREALMGGFADSPILRQHGERMINGDFEPGGRAELQLKDLRTSRELAQGLGLDLPLLGLTEKLYREMCDHGRSALDHSALYLELADRGR